MTKRITLTQLAWGDIQISDHALPDGLTVADLGPLHIELLATLDVVKEALNDAMRAERADGATYAELMKRSGYRSIEQVRQIVKPGVREQVRERERARRAS